MREEGRGRKGGRGRRREGKRDAMIIMLDTRIINRLLQQILYVFPESKGHTLGAQSL